MTSDPTNIVHLQIVEVGDGYHAEPDNVLEGAKGMLRQVVVIGVQRDGGMYVAGTDGSAASVFLMERAKAVFVGAANDEFE